MKIRSKNIIVGLALFAIVLCVGASSAYFVFTGRSHSIITTATGGVGVNLEEIVNGVPVEIVGDLFVMPGQTVDQAPFINNTDTAPVWLRMRASITHDGSDASSLVLAHYNTDYWQYNSADGYYYYYRALPAKEATEPMFTTLTFSPDMGNEYMGATINVIIKADAVQVTNPDDTPMTAKGWPEEV